LLYISKSSKNLKKNIGFFFSLVAIEKLQHHLIFYYSVFSFGEILPKKKTGGVVGCESQPPTSGLVIFFTKY
jgi:hypothetical protein